MSTLQILMANLKKLKAIVRDYSSHALNTIFEIYQEKYSEEWDATLNGLLDYAEVHGHDGFTGTVLTISGVKIWTENRWYGFGHIYDSRVYEYHRPKFKTMRRLAAYIDLVNHQLAEQKSKFNIQEYSKILADVTSKL